MSQPPKMSPAGVGIGRHGDGADHRGAPVGGVGRSAGHRRDLSRRRARTASFLKRTSPWVRSKFRPPGSAPRIRPPSVSRGLDVCSIRHLMRIARAGSTLRERSRSPHRDAIRPTADEDRSTSASDPVRWSAGRAPPRSPLSQGLVGQGEDPGSAIRGGRPRVIVTDTSTLARPHSLRETGERSVTLRRIDPQERVRMGPHMRAQERDGGLGVGATVGPRCGRGRRAGRPRSRRCGPPPRARRSGPPRGRTSSSRPVAAGASRSRRRDGGPVGLDRRTHPRVVESGGRIHDALVLRVAAGDANPSDS